MFVRGSWIKLDWRAPEDAGERLFEVHVPINPNYESYFQGATSKNVFRLNRGYGEKYQWYGLRLHEDGK